MGMTAKKLSKNGQVLIALVKWQIVRRNENKKGTLKNDRLLLVREAIARWEIILGPLEIAAKNLRHYHNLCRTKFESNNKMYSYDPGITNRTH